MPSNQTGEIDEVFEAEIDLRAAEGSLKRAHSDADLSVVGLLHPLAQAEAAQSLRVALATARLGDAREESIRGRRSRARVARWRVFLRVPPQVTSAHAVALPAGPVRPDDRPLTPREKRVLERDARDA